MKNWFEKLMKSSVTEKCEYFVEKYLQNYLVSIKIFKFYGKNRTPRVFTFVHYFVGVIDASKSIKKRVKNVVKNN